MTVVAKALPPGGFLPTLTSQPGIGSPGVTSFKSIIDETTPIARKRRIVFIIVKVKKRTVYCSIALDEGNMRNW